MRNYRELHVWKKGIEIVKGVYELIKQLPKEEKYGVISQASRAAVSISANIAEGSSRDSDKDYARFLQIALGSAFELQTYITIVKEMNWVEVHETDILEKLIEQEIKMLYAFLKKLTEES